MFHKPKNLIINKPLIIYIWFNTLFLNHIIYSQPPDKKEEKGLKNIEEQRDLKLIYPDGYPFAIEKENSTNNKPVAYQQKENSSFNITYPNRLKKITQREWVNLHLRALSKTNIPSFRSKSKINEVNFGKLVPKQIAFGKPNENKTYISTFKPHKDDKLYNENNSVEVFTDIELGTFKVNSEEIYLYILDYGSIDGDIVKIYNNEKLIHDNFFLTRQLRKYKIPLEYGFNKIAIVGVSHGTERPLTCYLEVRDPLKNTIKKTKYALSVGFKAELLFIKN